MGLEDSNDSYNLTKELNYSETPNGFREKSAKSYNQPFYIAYAPNTENELLFQHADAEWAPRCFSFHVSAH